MATRTDVKTGTLLELAERCEQATADEQHEVLVKAYEEVFAPLNSFMRRADDTRRIAFLRCLGAGAFLDAALTLVPEEWAYRLSSAPYRKGHSADLWPPIIPGDGPFVRRGDAATPALALCAAALRARAA